MGDVNNFTFYFRKPSMTLESFRSKRKGTHSSACSQCGAHLQTYCTECCSLYVDYNTLYECGNCGTPKNMYCGLCGAPQTLEHFYFKQEELL